MSEENHIPLRAYRSREEVDQLLQSYDSSGLTQARFAEKHGIRKTTLQYWLRRRRIESRRANPHPAVSPVTLRQPIQDPQDRIEVSLTNGRTVRFPVDINMASIAAIVASLDS